VWTRSNDLADLRLAATQQPVGTTAEYHKLERFDVTHARIFASYWRGVSLCFGAPGPIKPLR
jgi:hypothetical protein